MTLCARPDRLSSRDGAETDHAIVLPVRQFGSQLATQIRILDVDHFFVRGLVRWCGDERSSNVRMTHRRFVGRATAIPATGQLPTKAPASIRGRTRSLGMIRALVICSTIHRPRSMVRSAATSSVA